MDIFIDTAVFGCNIALFDDDRILAQANEEIDRGHAEKLLPLYQGLMQSINKSAEDLENIYVTIGPGSFTGLRVGLSVARFMAYSLQKPLFGITTFQSFSCAVTSPHDRMVLIETKRSDFYCQILNADNQEKDTAQSLTLDQVVSLLDGKDDIILTGDAVDRFQKETENQYVLDMMPQRKIDCSSVISAIQNNLLTLRRAEAFYIRDADVSAPKKES